MSLSLQDYIFELPEELIAQKPLKHRDASRMMVLDKKSGKIQHSYIKNIFNFINKGDVLVLNNTKVMQCRIMAKRETGGIVEILFIKKCKNSDVIWEAMIKPMRRLKEKEKLLVLSAPYTAELLEKLPSGRALVQLNIDISTEHFFEKYGLPPIPPYIKRDYTKYNEETLKEDKVRYQTIYAQKNGSVAAPTAGLHFSRELLNALEKQGIKLAKVTLHVGPGTFVPISTEKINTHRMESERYEISQETSSIINEAKKSGRKVIAVGSTVVRTLESVAKQYGAIIPTSGETDLFIYPPYDFKVIDGMLTNFHLPGSTLIVMVAAFAGYDFTMQAYKEAILNRYRFFSFGDCMLIL